MTSKLKNMSQKLESYSQCGQDLFVISLLGKNGTFLDLGCYLPIKINNTYLLELNGWKGISIDIVDYKEEWEARKNNFLCEDCFKIDYEILLPKHYESKTIDYLSLDMEEIGERFKLLEKVLMSGYDFKIITIEHDSYRSPEFLTKEKNLQVEILKKYGYELICSDISNPQFPMNYYEDWWVNPKYFDMNNLLSWKAEKVSFNKIFENNEIEFFVNPISLTW